MESGQTTKSEALSGKRDMSPKLTKVLGRLFGEDFSQQDLQDALSLVNSHVPGGDRAVIEEIEKVTSDKWPQKRRKAALALAERVRSLCNHPSFIGAEEVPLGDPVSGYCGKIADMGVATPPREEPIVLTGHENRGAVPSSNATDRLKDLQGLRERSIRDLAGFMGQGEEIIRELLSFKTKQFTAKQVDLIMKARGKLGLNNQDSEQTKEWIENMASSGAPMGTCRRLGQLLGIRFHRDKRGAYSMEQVGPKSIGEINSNVSRGSKDVTQAESDLLNGLVVAISLKSPIEAISAS